MDDEGGKGLKGETAIFQPKVEHWALGWESRATVPIDIIRTFYCLRDVAGQTTTWRSLHMPLLLHALCCKRFAFSETTLPFFEASRHILPCLFYPAYSEINHPISLLYFCHSVFPWRI